MRPTNNYGTHQYPEKLIPLCIKNILRNKKIHLHDAGTPIRNWLHVEDTVSAIITVLESGKRNEIYNVAGGYEQQNKDTVRKVLKAFFGPNLVNEKFDTFVDLKYKRPGQDVRYAVSDTKLRKLGWAPSKVFDDAIGDIVEFYKSQSRW